jgi:hypothetical protein
MQLCQKESLRHWLKTNWTIDQAVRTVKAKAIFHEICLGVEYVHAQGLIHRYWLFYFVAFTYFGVPESFLKWMTVSLLKRIILLLQQRSSFIFDISHIWVWTRNNRKSFFFFKCLFWGVFKTFYPLSKLVLYSIWYVHKSKQRWKK